MIHGEEIKKLGQMLVEQGRITGEQLIRAIQSQRMVGGRIGTCLLEMDVLSEDELLDALSQQLAVPAARIEQLRRIDDDTLDLIPARLANRCQAVPFAADRHEVKVATLNVHNLTYLDELGFAANKRVRPYIANEVRIFEALEKYYGLEIPRRYGYLLDRLNRSRYLWDESAKILLGAGEVEMAGWSEPQEAFESSDLILAPSASSHHHAAAVPAAPASPVSRSQNRREPPSDDTFDLEAVDARLATAQDMGQLADALLDFAARAFTRTALLRLRQGHVKGYRLRGADADEHRFRELDLAPGTPSLFLDLGIDTSHYRGPLAPMPAHRQLAQAWGGELPRECLAVPIQVRQRPVLVLYGDRGPLGLGGLDVELFLQLADRASMALELCVLRKKLRTA